MLLAFDKTKNGAVIPDFQSRASAETLIENAVRAGVAREAIEIREIDPEQAKALEIAYYYEAREQLKADEAARAAAADALKKRLGLSDPDVQALRDLLAG